MFTLLLMSAAVTAAQPFRLEGAGTDSDQAVLHRALNAPEKPRVANQLRYCVKVEGDAARSKVCRTEREWMRLGLMPLAG